MKVKLSPRLDKGYIESTGAGAANADIKRLSRAMLRRAIDDLKHKETFNCAREYIFNKSKYDYLYSFAECCERLGFDPKVMRVKIFEICKDSQEFKQ